MIAGIVQHGGRLRTLCESLPVVAFRFVALLLGGELARAPQRVLLKTPEAGQRQINCSKPGAALPSVRTRLSAPAASDAHECWPEYRRSPNVLE
jgi:hypothetical protein